MATLRYCEQLRAEVVEAVLEQPTGKMRRCEWAKLREGDPIQINPSIGTGYRVRVCSVPRGRLGG
jgi:hypothetical protein